MSAGQAYAHREDRDEVISALEELGRFVSSSRWEATLELHEPLIKTLLDTIGVAIAGAQTEEARSLRSAWSPAAGRSRVLGAGFDTTPEAAAYLNGFSTVTLELDEGNKHARGHPAAHIFPPALAIAQEREASGPELAASLVAGYETASRFGRATRLHPGVHPHGNWGTAGSAAAVARLMRLDARETGAALDIACSSLLATPFETALSGSAARDGWVGLSATSGIAAARMAAASIADNHGLAHMTLGRMIGSLEAGELTSSLGERFDLTNGYFKRHASCSYTHPPADALLKLLRDNPTLRPERVRAMQVETHSLAATLEEPAPATRLAAMFSIPYVLAAVLVNGGCAPQVFLRRFREDKEIERLSRATRLTPSEELDRRPPEERAARVTVTLDDGGSLAAEVPNPVGDVAYHPFDLEDIRGKLDGILPSGGPGAWELEKTVRELLRADNVNDVLAHIP